MLKLPVTLGNLISNLKVLWTHWNVQSLVLASFIFQLILIFTAPFRKQSSNVVVVVSIWFSYLLADWVATQAVGLISKAPVNAATTELYAFWAQFLLLHLGGPDTITALALEDNELWLRTGLHLGTQVYATLGVLVRSIQQNSLWIPTILMFVAGIIKYLERISSLFRGRLTKIHKGKTPGADQLEQYKPSSSKGDLTNVELVKDASYFFHYYKGLYADREFAYNERKKSIEYFSNRTAEQAFRVLEIQLNFAYEAFYTKTALVHMKSWKVFRGVVTVIEVVCLVIWSNSSKHGFRNHEIKITYVLLTGAIFVDILAFIRIHLSDWNIALLKIEPRSSSIRSWIYSKLLSTRKRRWLRRAFFRRWSESVLQLNLIQMCTDERPKTTQKVIDCLGIKDMLDGRRYVTKKWFSDQLRDIIFRNLQFYDIVESLSKVNKILQVMSFMCYSKGQFSCRFGDNIDSEMTEFFKVGKYEHVLLVWHMLTELYYTEEEGKKDGSMEDYRTISKTLSDYAMYLLVRKPDMMSAVAGQIVEDMLPTTFDSIHALCKENIEYLDKSLPLRDTMKMTERKKAQHWRACSAIREAIRDRGAATNIVKNSEMLCDVQKLRFSMLKTFEAEEQENNKWEFIANVWIELICYAAIRCKPSVHATQLKQGGELLTFVWLLMLQLGIGMYHTESSNNSYVEDRQELHRLYDDDGEDDVLGYFGMP